MILLHENSKGIKIVREDGKKRSKVRVIASDGHTLHTYRFNNIPFFVHPLLSWANLDYCGDWAYDKDYLLTAVQDGKKPVADITSDSLPDIAPSPDIDVCDPVPTTNGPYTWLHMIVARRGMLTDLFDLNKVVAAYAALGIEIGPELLQPYFSTPLITLFQDRFWVNPRTLEEWVVTGLGLGYPIESTASLLEGY